MRFYDTIALNALPNARPNVLRSILHDVHRHDPMDDAIPAIRISSFKIKSAKLWIGAVVVRERDDYQQYRPVMVCLIENVKPRRCSQCYRRVSVRRRWWMNMRR